MNKSSLAMKITVTLQIVAILFIIAFMLYPTEANFSIFLAVTPLIATYIVDSVYFLLPDNYKQTDKLKEEKFIKQINLCISLMILVLFLNIQDNNILVVLSFLLYFILFATVIYIVRTAYNEFTKNRNTKV